ncbi:MAG: phosphoribosylamine--glycine ligase [Candidatus Gastranaerophilales bacterium]|nr:phosphoribosylamine--glycine ligase [Candidatus Gastranaerophilales bacterium]
MQRVIILQSSPLAGEEIFQHKRILFSNVRKMVRGKKNYSLLHTPHPEILALVPRAEFHPSPTRGEGKYSDAAMNVLVLGSGAREHAIADAIFKSKLLNKLYLADANDGFADIGEVISYENYEALAKKCVNLKINIAVIGPEEPLCEGIVDIFNKYKIPCIGVNKYFSQLESSKLFGKKFMKKYGIKTAKYHVIASEAKQSKNIIKFPVAIKANGLCKGKGVVIAYDEKIAQETIKECLNGKFGEASKTILIEEFLQGEELSLISLWDGKSLLYFPPARDFKKLNSSVDAPNTGGMGAFCPVALTQEQEEKLGKYKQQLQNALKSEKADFVGFIYSGLIWAKEDWYVLEYNVRLGDPETQAILTHLKTDFLFILKSALNKNLDKITLHYKNNYSACLVIACQGYPNDPKDGEKIVIPASDEVKIFYAGVKKINNKLYSKGGRVLSLCANAPKPFAVGKYAHLTDFADKIEMKNKYYRRDL